jgi:hypothetical protein
MPSIVPIVWAKNCKSISIIVMPAGRPTDYTEDKAKGICDGIRMGLSFTKAARSIGVDEATATGWMERFPGFAGSVEEAKAECEFALVEKISKAAQSGSKTVTRKVRSGAFGFEETTTTTDDGTKYAQWMLPRINPDRWSEKAHVAKIVEAKVRQGNQEFIQYLMSVVSDSAKVEISNALLAAGFEVSAIAGTLPDSAQD